MEHAHAMIRDIFSDRKGTKMKQTNFYLVFKKRSTHKEVIEKDKDYPLHQLIKDVLLNLNVNSFKVFEN